MLDPEVRILVAEDDADWQSDLRTVLEGAGFTVESVTTYDTAIAGLQASDIALAVVDMSLKPGDAGNVDGIRILHWLAEQERSTPAILISAYATNVDMLTPTIRQLRCNIAGVMLKREWSDREFLCLVRGVLGLPQDEPPHVKLPRSWRPARPPRSKQANGFDVLVVEDDWAWQEDFKEELAAEGYAVTVVASYAKALSQLKRGLFDVAVVDFRLAGLDQGNIDGYRLLSDLQKAGIPAIVVSGLPRPELMRGALREHDVYYTFSKADWKWAKFKEEVRSAAEAGIGDEKLASLSPTEYRIVKAMCQGIASDRDLANHLGLKEHRVRDMVYNILKKLGLSSRAEIAPYVFRTRQAWKTLGAPDEMRQHPDR